MSVDIGNPQACKREAGKLADGMGMTVGQDRQRRPMLYRRGHAPDVYPTWLSLLTELRRLRELLPRSQALLVNSPNGVTVERDALPPMAQIVDVDSTGKIVTSRRSATIAR